MDVDKQIEVAAETEHAWRARTRDQVAQLVGLTGELRDNAALQRVDVVEQRQVVAGPPVRAHEGPQRAVGLVEIDFKLIEFEQAPAIGAFFQINQRSFRWRKSFSRGGDDLLLVRDRAGERDPSSDGLGICQQRHLHVPVNRAFTLLEKRNWNNAIMVCSPCRIGGLPAGDA